MSDDAPAGPVRGETAPGFLVGVLEGFYGREWSHQTRLAYANYLADAGFNACLYAPKGDAVLRRQWRDTWAAPQHAQMAALAGTYRQRGLHWGVGLSPMELYRSYGALEREQL